MTLDDLTAIAEPPAALLIELPQRDLGGQQPDWDDLQAQVDWARDRGAAVHLDGARLWESAAGYGRPPAEIAALFDTVYVSFYKGIGALPGCCVAGPADVIAEVREWRQRMGGTLFGLWPNAASALSCLRRRLPLMPAVPRATPARSRPRSPTCPGVRVVPDPPQVPMMHLLLARRRTASPRRPAGWPPSSGSGSGRQAMPTGDPGGAAGRAVGRRRHLRAAARPGPRHHRRAGHAVGLPGRAGTARTQAAGCPDGAAARPRPGRRRASSTPRGPAGPRR